MTETQVLMGRDIAPKVEEYAFPRMKSEYTTEDKIQALKALIYEAHTERESAYPNRAKNPFAPEFDPAGHQQVWINSLVEALKTTDALAVLHSLVNGVDEK